MVQKDVHTLKPKKIFSDKKRYILAAISAVIGVIIFAISYVGMRQQIGLGNLNQPVLTWMINHRSGFVTEIAKLITSIANPLVFAFIVGVLIIAWAGLKKEVWRPAVLAGSIAVAAETSMLLKTVFMDIRPPHIDMVPAFEYDFSFPSGHTIGMAVFLLVLGYLIYSRRFSVGRFWAWIAIAVIGTGLVAFSRLYLGYHWLTDVVASVGLALIILAVVIVVDIVFVTNRLQNLNNFFQDIDQ
jgi:membrane-associated phospholipid phosphatase